MKNARFQKPGFALFLFFLPIALNAQRSVEIGLATFYTKGMNLTRHYQENPENDIASTGSWGFNGALAYVKSRTPKLSWVAGLDFGLYAFRLDLFVSDEFNYLGWGGYSDFYKEYRISYFGLSGGIRYTLGEDDNNRLYAQADVLVNYHLRSHGSLSAYAIPDNGRVKQLFDAEMINNDDNKIIVAPRLGLHYQRRFKNGRSGLNLGFSAVYSGQEPFHGSYQILGDAEVLEGSLAKPFNYLGFDIGGVFYLK
ncbi:MAG: hypothetical protein KDC66_14245 [Phaeodactylibacter sp.]|nr:hypothetical protein [Phaeodactylibacter sp.]